MSYSLFTLYCCVQISRSSTSAFGQHQETEVWSDKHHWARLWVVGSSSPPGGVDSSSVGWRSQSENGVQEKCSRAGSVGVRRPVWQVHCCVTSNWSAACSEFPVTKWRLVTWHWCKLSVWVIIDEHEIVSLFVLIHTHSDFTVVFEINPGIWLPLNHLSAAAWRPKTPQFLGTEKSFLISSLAPFHHYLLQWSPVSNSVTQHNALLTIST